MVAFSDDVTTQLEATGAHSPRGERRAYVMVQNDGRVDVIAVDEGTEIVVGRASAADIVVADGRVSRRHSALVLRDGALVVRDLGGRNGTRVDDAVLRNEERPVRRGQRVTVGPAHITVVSLPQAEVASRAGGIVVEDPAMKAVMELVPRVAAAPTVVLIRGETGVGKEVVAHEIHRLSPRHAKPFVRLNCAAVPEALLESELFGHERGAFTGAVARKRGFFEAAAGGTLFLDEIGDVPLAVQVKLLRALESKQIQRVGATAEIAVDVRIVCATHRDLETMIAEQSFREDLFYRIAGFVLEVPSLRERPLDIAPLARSFLDVFSKQLGSPPPELSREALTALQRHAFPGNVRELKNAVEHAAVLAGADCIEPHHFPKSITQRSPAGLAVDSALSEGAPRTMGEHVEEAERRAIEKALSAADGHRARAAEILGVSKRTLQYKLAKLGIKE